MGANKRGNDDMKQKEFKQKFLGVLAGTAFLLTVHSATAEEATPLEMPAPTQGEIIKKAIPETSYLKT